MSKLRNELDKLSGLIIGKNVLQSPLDFWERYDAWREAAKGLEQEIKRMEEKMERLTHERVNGIKTGYWSPEKKETLVNALAEYEGTGLTPDEINALQERDTAKAIVVNDMTGGIKLYSCPICDMPVHEKDNFCSECGQRIKREGWPCMKS